jgi:hypothetical protein
LDIRVAQGDEMTIGNIEDSQSTASKVVGFAYLCALVPAIFAEFYVRGELVVPNAAQTAVNIAAHERLFRLGIASNLAVFALDVALITALYVVLRPVNRLLALLALGWGLVETAILIITTLTDLDALRVLSGAQYLKAFEADQLQALARLSIAAHGAAYNAGLVFAGLRSTGFCYLWFKSGYIPKALAGWGIVASSVMGTCAFLFIVFPELAKVVPVQLYGGPIFIFELTIGFWLLVKGIRRSNED